MQYVSKLPVCETWTQFSGWNLSVEFEIKYYWYFLILGQILIYFNWLKNYYVKNREYIVSELHLVEYIHREALFVFKAIFMRKSTKMIEKFHFERRQNSLMPPPASENQPIFRFLRTISFWLQPVDNGTWIIYILILLISYFCLERNFDIRD